jgi:Protein of unknown function, DUF255
MRKRRLISALLICCVLGAVAPAADKPKYEAGAAAKVLDDAVAKAQSQGTLVFLKSGFPECGWCNVFDKYHAFPETKAIVEKYYVVAKIDTSYMPDGKEIFSKFAQPGAPSWVIISADKKIVIDSYAAKGNVGYPYHPDEIAHYRKALKQATPKISDAELDQLEALLKRAAKKDAE